MNERRLHWQRMLRGAWWWFGFSAVLFAVSLPWAYLNFKLAGIGVFAGLLLFGILYVQGRTGFWLGPVVVFGGIAFSHYAPKVTTAPPQSFGTSICAMAIMFLFCSLLMIACRRRLLQNPEVQAELSSSKSISA
jgi:hypothetical protein